MKLIYDVDWIKNGLKKLENEERETGRVRFLFWVLCGELMKWSFENENWRSNRWIMIWMIDFNKKMSERWRNLREKWRSIVHAWEMMMKWWRTSEEIMIGKCLMKVKCMDNGLRDWSWHKNGWEMKKIWEEMEVRWTVKRKSEERLKRAWKNRGNTFNPWSSG